MKLNKIAIACGVALIGASSLAQAEVSANIGATSNYIWRGISQTDNGAAVQGGLDWSDASGIYAGTWASNIDGGTELDIYGGYSGKAGEFGYDVGVIGYLYPDLEDLDFWELYANGSYGMFSGGVAYTIDKEAGGEENDLYYHLGLSTDLPNDFSLGFTVGYYDFEDDAAEDYTHYQVDLGKSAGEMGDFTFSLSMVDEEAYDDDLKAFVSWSKGF